MAYVYRHIRLDNNEVFYIGIGIRKNYLRAKTIVRRNQYWINVINKTEWKFEIIFDNISFDEAKEKEIELIKMYGRKDKGLGTLVNLTDGGDGTAGNIVTQKVKERLSIINTGKTLSQDHKGKIALSNTGKTASIESRLKMRNAKIGKKQTAETIAARVLKLMGNKSRTGYKASDELKEKQKAGQIRRREREANIKKQVL